jgi:hypothetical protein
MSIQLIRQYHTRVAKIIKYSGTHNESALRAQAVSGFAGAVRPRPKPGTTA